MIYKIQNDFQGNPVAVTIVGQTISIPMNPDNTDYQEYLKYIAEGGTVLPAEDNS